MEERLSNSLKTDIAGPLPGVAAPRKRDFYDWAPEHSAPGQNRVPAAANDAGGPALSCAGLERAAEMSAPQPKWGRVSLELPGYLIKELKERAVENGTPLRFIVMSALRGQDFKVRDADLMEDALAHLIAAENLAR
jgi:hypothetical protein